MTLDWGIALRYWPLLAQGLVLTLEITLLVTALGLLLGIVVAAGRLSRAGIVNKPIAGYIELFRGTPALVQLYWFYYVMPILLGVDLPGLTAVIIALTLKWAPSTARRCAAASRRYRETRPRRPTCSASPTCRRCGTWWCRRRFASSSRCCCP